MELKTLTVIPTYNELEALPVVIKRLRAAQPEVHVLIVDDNSPDGTGDLADGLAAQDSKIHVLHRKGKGGLGAAYIAGFKWGLDRDYEVLVEMDADSSHQPEQLGRLLEAVDNGADLAIGSRYVPGGQTINWPWHRQFLSRGANFYAQTILGTSVKDITAGYRAFRRGTLERIDLDTIESVGYCFQIDLGWRTELAGLTITEVPITFVERELGDSKMDSGVILESMFKVARWGLGARAKTLSNKARALGSNL
ncbi:MULTISPECIES: polyprenol monophosphomannose synthase [Micrococcaceae]|uniref:polyprenol monophosphomannose synthase n=1 Tax=unclassified Kocuria TaxID=2649579 RepID=UPI001013A60D|nr:MULTISPECIES: polyprenol monophosphomannose synthase [unclassified Kocuria]